MTVRSDTSPRVPAQEALPPLTEARPFYWSVRRELWENRYLSIAPVIVTAFVLFGLLISLIGLPGRMRTLPTLDPAAQHVLVVRPFAIAPSPIMLATFLIGMFFALEALHGERRDRSILFWKSMPVSDRTTVLAKVSIPLVWLPLYALVLSVATQAILLCLSTAVLLGSRMSPGPLWTEFRFVQGFFVMIYGLTVHALWFAPIFGWLMLISAWARRATFLWAVLPLLAVSAAERVAFNSTHVMAMLEYRLMGAMTEAFVSRPTRGHVGIIDQFAQLDPAGFVTAPGLWAGLVFAAVFLAGAVRLRRHREPL